MTVQAGTNTTAKDLKGFVESVESNHGYYIARYEASYGSGTSVTNYKPLSKVSTANSTSSMSYTRGTLWNRITQGDAAAVARNMYVNNLDANGNSVGVESDLINSYAWDTAIVYIQKMGNANYANQTDGNGTLKNTGETGDVKCNIYDMAGNEDECTTETSSFSFNNVTYCYLHRGGSYTTSSASTSNRTHSFATYSAASTSFRIAIYVK